MNFKANHNYGINDVSSSNDVCLYANIWILKQITTTLPGWYIYYWCLSLCKYMNFKANHNSILSFGDSVADVCLYANIWILKQITTCQRWRNLSQRCLSLCKYMNFKANHNTATTGQGENSDVCLYANIWILKQITTVLIRLSNRRLMFVSMQIYEF